MSVTAFAHVNPKKLSSFLRDQKSENFQNLGALLCFFTKLPFQKQQNLENYK